MRRRLLRPRSVLAFWTLSSLILLPRHSSAAWPSNTNDAVAVCTATGTQADPVIVSDGAGGVIVAWEDARAGNNDIYALRLLANGDIAPGWSANGNAICTQTAGQTNPSICSDGGGGAIIVWQDARATTSDIFAQRVSGAGVTQWLLNGVQLCSATGAQQNPKCVEDGSGGAFVVWDDLRVAGNSDIWAQRVTSAGALSAGWGALTGLSIHVGAGTQVTPRTMRDSQGGVFFLWVDGVASAAKRYTAAGMVVAGWAAPVFVADNSIAVVPDDLGGLLSATSVSDAIYLQRFNPAGGVDWSWSYSMGLGGGFPTGLVAVADGVGGMIVAYQTGSSGVRGIRIARGGGVLPGWPLSLGENLTNVFTTEQVLVRDGLRGAILVATGIPSGPNFDVWAQHVQHDGEIVVMWPTISTPPGGLAVAQAPQDQTLIQATTDGAGGAIVVWQDQRAGFGIHDIYAQRIEFYGQLGNPEPKIVEIRDVPSDQGGQVRIRWAASYVDSVLRYVDLYSVWRQVPPAAAQEAIRGGALILGDGSDVHRSAAATTAREAGRRVLQAVAGEAGVTFWELLVSLSAHGYGTYSYVASTTSDSTSAGNPFTLYRVEAEEFIAEEYPLPPRRGTAYWRSAPDSGYSVDNLAPAAPAPFAGNYNGGEAALHWRANGESDLRGYRLYRGASAGFVPAPSNLVVETADTAYVDAAGAPYFYKLSAVDIHDNESGFTALLPNGTTGTPDGDRVALAFWGVTPNPVATEAQVRFSLSRTGRVRLSIVDVMGRNVRTLIDGERAAGEQTVEWNGLCDDGKLARSGVYLVRLVAEGRQLHHKVLVAR